MSKKKVKSKEGRQSNKYLCCHFYNVKATEASTTAPYCTGKYSSIMCLNYRGRNRKYFVYRREILFVSVITKILVELIRKRLVVSPYLGAETQASSSVLNFLWGFRTIISAEKTQCEALG